MNYVFRVFVFAFGLGGASRAADFRVERLGGGVTELMAHTEPLV